MTNPIIKQFENEQIKQLSENKNYPEFSSGDLLNVKVKIGDRTQNFEGVCIARKNRGINSSFTLRKISYGEGVERVFPYYSKMIEEISVLKKGKVRRAKLYYIKDRSGKAARIAEATTGYKMKRASLYNKTKRVKNPTEKVVARPVEAVTDL